MASAIISPTSSYTSSFLFSSSSSSSSSSFTILSTRAQSHAVISHVRHCRTFKRVSIDTRSSRIASKPSWRSGAIRASLTPSVLPSALLFDCDGVLVDTEKDGHRVSFNDTFAERELGVTWGVDLYGELLKIGGGKERMTAYFNKTAWPEKAPTSEQERKEFIASLHKRKTELFMALIEKKLLPLRPGVAKSCYL